jgi:hypothetical protein
MGEAKHHALIGSVSEYLRSKDFRQRAMGFNLLKAVSRQLV